MSPAIIKTIPPIVLSMSCGSINSPVVIALCKYLYWDNLYTVIQWHVMELIENAVSWLVYKELWSVILSKALQFVSLYILKLNIRQPFRAHSIGLYTLTKSYRPHFQEQMTFCQVICTYLICSLVKWSIVIPCMSMWYQTANAHTLPM